MERKEAERLADSIAKDYAKNGNSEKVINDLKTLRNYFIEIKDPTLTKIIRLTYEYLENNEDFDLVLEDFEEESEESSFEYLMQLVVAYDNPYNREELNEYKQLMMEA
ncbi:MAG: hypothetical protein K1X56_06605 [Flavobacteriales bacterium]|nr:hypothetical protein [Flavobacteriales bacterium]